MQYPPRRSHHKSRGGCVTCKQRRVKCDQVKPAYTACLRRRMVCSYVGAASPILVDRTVDTRPSNSGRQCDTSTIDACSSATSTTEGLVARQTKRRTTPRNQQSFDILDLRLLAHLSAELCPSFDMDRFPDQLESASWQSADRTALSTSRTSSLFSISRV